MIQFGVLGPLEVRSSSTIIEVSGARRRALLAYLLVHAGVPQPLDRIVDALDASADTVQTYISQLRKLVGNDGAGIVHRAGGYLLEFPSDALDATRFERGVAEASGESDPEARLARLNDAIELWRGPPLDEFAGREWADDRARHWTRMYMLAQQLRIGALLDAGQHRDARALLEPLVAAHPLHEPFWEQLVIARYRCGEQGEALAAAREARAVLARELGVEPGPALIEAERRVLEHDPTLMVPNTASPRVPSTTRIRAELPDGVVTFLLTDIESSTQLWDDHPDEMAKALARYEDLVEEVVEHHRGRLLKWRGEGDSTMSVFSKATDACAAAVALQRCLGAEVWPSALELRTRAALHTGEAQQRGGDYYGGTLNRAGRIRSMATGGETLVSRATHDLVADALPIDVRLIDVGEHEIRGLRRAENLFVLNASGVAAPATGSRSSDASTSLSDDFIGRFDDVERVVVSLTPAAVVTIVGPGGIGKTRLMREVRAISHGYDRIYLVELAGARDRVAVEGALHAALVNDDAANPIAARRSGDGPVPVVDELAAGLGSRRSLLMIDNCEHLLDDVADLVGGITARCATVSILTTSREPLDLSNERVIALGPLAVPDQSDATLERLEDVDAIRLLIRRARDAGSDLAVTAETLTALASLCRLLDGVPLALELAAARLRSTTPAELCARLEGQMHVLDTKRGDPRHRSLYSAIDWSYQLLDPVQQLLMRRLAIFVGGFTLSAAEEVCTDEQVLAGSSAVYVNLAELVSKSLVMFDRERNRYRLLEPVRVFAREQLDAHSETAAVARQHARWALHLSMAAVGGQVYGTSGTASIAAVDLDNMHAALDWLDATGDHDTFLRMVAALGFTWFGSDWRRGRIAAVRAVELLDDARPRLRGSVLLSRGIVEQRSEMRGSIPFFEEAGEIFVAMLLAWTIFFYGRGHLVRDNPTSARSLRLAAEMFHEIPMPIGEAWSLVNLGTIFEMNDDLDGARELYERARSIATALGHKSLEGTVVGELAGIAVAQHDLDRARVQLQEAIALQEAGKDFYNVNAHLNDLTLVELLAGNLARAREHLTAALRMGFEIDDPWQLSEALLLLAVVLLEEGMPREARRMMAATGWDIEPPEGLMEYSHSILAVAIGWLQPIMIGEYDNAAAEGRRLGRYETARAFLAEQGS
jgi:predicted ATPase/class 3 adenylate cyclase